MITREQYLEALDIVETYHQQFRQYSVGRSLKGWNDLQIGDKVIFSKTMSKDVCLKNNMKLFGLIQTLQINMMRGFSIGHNGSALGEGGDFNHKSRCGERMLNIAVNVERSTAPPLLPNVC